jgi:hypothetical protein
MPMIWRSRPQLVLVLSSAILFEAFSVPLEGRRWGPGPGVTTPAPKVGWSVRNPRRQPGTRVYWRFGATPDQLSAPMTWVQAPSLDQSHCLTAEAQGHVLCCGGETTDL